MCSEVPSVISFATTDLYPQYMNMVNVQYSKENVCTLVGCNTKLLFETRHKHT
jgi:hypothetical protein